MDKDDDVNNALFPGFQQRDRQPLPAILPPHDDIFQDADESQPLTSDSQQNTPQHVANPMMVTPAVSDALNIWFNFFLFSYLFILILMMTFGSSVGHTDFSNDSSPIFLLLLKKIMKKSNSR